MRATWSGNLQIGGTTIPIKMYTQATKLKESKAQTHYVSPCCGESVGRKNYCKECGKELERSDITHREFEGVIIPKEKLKEIKSQASDTLEIKDVKNRDEVDSLWRYKTYSIKADTGEEEDADKVLAIICKALILNNKVLQGKFVMRSSKYLVDILPTSIGDEVGLIARPKYFKQARRSPPENWGIDDIELEDEEIQLGNKIIQNKAKMDTGIDEVSYEYENFKELVKALDKGEEAVLVKESEPETESSLMDSLNETAQAMETEVESEAQEKAKVEAQ